MRIVTAAAIILAAVTAAGCASSRPSAPAAKAAATDREAQQKAQWKQALRQYLAAMGRGAELTGHEQTLRDAAYSEWHEARADDVAHIARALGAGEAGRWAEMANEINSVEHPVVRQIAAERLGAVGFPVD